MSSLLNLQILVGRLSETLHLPQLHLCRAAPGYYCIVKVLFLTFNVVLHPFTFLEKMFDGLQFILSRVSPNSPFYISSGMSWEMCARVCVSGCFDISVFNYRSHDIPRLCCLLPTKSWLLSSSTHLFSLFFFKS